MLIRLDAASLAALEVRLNCRRLHARWLREKAARSVAAHPWANAAPKRRRRSPDLQSGPAPRVLDHMPRH